MNAGMDLIAQHQEELPVQRCAIGAEDRGLARNRVHEQQFSIPLDLLSCYDIIIII
jgi:hypothetical protein